MQGRSWKFTLSKYFGALRALDDVDLTFMEEDISLII